MAKKLTTASIANIKPDPTRRTEIPDAVAPGLYLVIQPSGSRAWAFRYRFNGRPQKMTLGTVNDRDSATAAPVIGDHLTLGDARHLAADQRHQLALGKDPAAVARKPKVETFPEAVEEFVVRYLSGIKTGDAVARSLRTDAVPVWQKRRLDGISRADLIALIDTKAESAPTQANRLLAHLRKFFNWCIARDLIAVSPAAGVKALTKEVSRDRVLADEEIAALWLAAERLGFPFGPMVKVLLLTGQRLSEVAEMERREIDSAGLTWLIPKERVKNGIAQAVPLTAEVLALIDSVPRIGNRYVFTTTGERPVSGFGKAKLRIDREMLAILQADVEPTERTMPHWQFHDCRRTAATIMARLGVAVHVVESVLNHKSGRVSGVAAVYNKYDYLNEKRAALEVLAAEITRVCAVPK